MPGFAAMSTPTHRGLVRALDAVKASQGWTDSQLATRVGVKQCNLISWRAGRSGIGEINLWRVRVFLGKYARQTA